MKTIHADEYIKKLDDAGLDYHNTQLIREFISKGLLIQARVELESLSCKMCDQIGVLNDIIYAVEEDIVTSTSGLVG
jgi:hypothetical protein